jgi:predicted permease
MSNAFYRTLLRLYPSSFRIEYEAELTRAYEEATRGEGGVVKAFAAVRDVVPNAFAAHYAILRQDLHYAFRSMRQSRGFVLTMILVTGLGVGANTATFSVADFVLLRPLPFPDAGSIMMLCEGPKDGGGWGCMNQLSPANYRDVTSQTRHTRGWGAFTGAEVNLVGSGEPLRVPASLVTREVFPTLGVRPFLGRMLDQADESIVVLSHRLWQSQFGGDPQIIGKTVRLDDIARTVVGVMPPGFYFPDRGAQLWMPLVIQPQAYENRNNTYLNAVGRLVPGSTLEQARSEFTMRFDRLSRDFPATNAETGFSLFKQRDQMLPRNRMILLALCGASLSLLLLTGANLANLLLVRAAARERELAVRAALGAGRERLIRQMLTEGVVLAALGGIAGLLIAAFAVPLLTYLVPSSLPLDAQPRLDGRALGLALAFTALVGIGFALIPATTLGRRGGFSALREGGRGGGGAKHRLRAALVSVEVAVSVMLLVSSAFLVRALWKVQAVDPGFSAEGVVMMRTTLPTARATDTVGRVQFYDQVLAGVKALPGVESAAYTSGVPMVLTGGITGIEITGAERPTDTRANAASFRLVTPEFFETLRLPITQGRAFEDADRMGRTLVAVVSESFAEHFWPNQAPIGKTFRTRGREYVVVGTARDIKVRGLERTSEPQLYIAAAQAGAVGGLYIPKDLMIRTNDRGLSLVPSVREVIRRVDANQPVSEIGMLTDVIDRMTADRRAQLRVLSALAVVALVLTAIGIHGLLAFMVAQRSREIGVRLALGAEPGRVARMIIGEAGRLAVIGAIPGLFAAYAAAKATQALLFGIPPGDPMTLVAGVVVVIAVTFAGAIVPAMRAVRVSPLEAIRAD